MITFDIKTLKYYVSFHAYPNLILDSQILYYKFKHKNDKIPTCIKRREIEH